MKTYEEMAQSALNKIGEEEKIREKRRKNVTKITGSAVSLCLVAAIGVGVWQSGLIGKVGSTNDLTAGTETTAQINTPDEPEKQIAELPAETSAKETADAGNNAEISDDTAMDACHFIWRNKVVMYGSLYWALENDPDGIYTVCADFRPTAEKAGDFTFEGETMTEIAERADTEWVLHERMYSLLVGGDDLKYGPSLCETGNADGVLWYKELYESTVAFIGEDLLDKYIVNGEFLADELKKDFEALERNREMGLSAETKYARAFNAYVETVLPAEMAKLTEAGIPCERTAGKNNSLTITVTADQLENLPLSDITVWKFNSDVTEIGDMVATDVSGD